MADITRRNLLSGLATLTGLVGLSACGGATSDGGSSAATAATIAEGGTLVYAIEEPITSLNWFNNCDTDLGKQVFCNLFDPLWKNNVDGSLDYRLAKSVDISEDGTTYTIVLRDDVEWSDGEKITADDILFTLDCLADAEFSPNNSSAYKVDGEFCTYEKKDDVTVEAKVGRASNLFKKAIGQLYVMPAHILEGVAANEVRTCAANENMVTSGAFSVDSFSVGEKLVCKKNEKYYRGPAHLDGFEVRIVGDASAQEIAFKNGELSLFTIANSETLSNYLSDSECNVVSYPDGRITFLQVNPNNEPMSTMDGRKAVIDSLDIDELVLGTYGDETLCRSATSILSRASMFYNPDNTNYVQNVDEAKQLIAETGLADKTIKIIFNSARVGQDALATMVKSQLDAQGLNAQIDSMETSAYFKAYFYENPDYSIAIMGNGTLDDPCGFVGLFNNTRSGKNMYTTDEVNGLWDELDREMDPEKRQKIMDEAIEALKECWSCVPVLETNYVCATQKNVGGIEDSDRLADLTKVYFTA